MVVVALPTLDEGSADVSVTLPGTTVNEVIDDARYGNGTHRARSPWSMAKNAPASRSRMVKANRRTRIYVVLNVKSNWAEYEPVL
jgi:hypothetical protein